MAVDSQRARSQDRRKTAVKEAEEAGFLTLHQQEQAHEGHAAEDRQHRRVEGEGEVADLGVESGALRAERLDAARQA